MRSGFIHQDQARFLSDSARDGNLLQLAGTDAGVRLLCQVADSHLFQGFFSALVVFRSGLLESAQPGGVAGDNVFEHGVV